MFGIAYNLVLAFVASEECSRKIGLGNPQLCIIAAPIIEHKYTKF